MAWLLDTNILSDLIRNPQGRVAEHIAEVGEDQIFTSIIVAAELRYGVAKRASKALTERVEAVLERLSIAPLERGADQAYAILRMQLEKAGTPVGGNDMLIAAHALSLGAVLVSDNTREFKRVKGLAVENWLR